jgi:tol-pal system protein YbgF
LKRHSLLTVLALGLTLTCGAPAGAVSREIIQIQQQLDTLQHAVESIEKTVDSQTAVLRTLIEQANDNVNAMKATIAELQRTNSQNLATSNSRFDTVTSQIQALSESLDEAKTRLSKLSDQMAQTQNIIQTLNPPQNAGGSPGGGNPAVASAGGPTAAPPPQPDPDTLYKSGLNDYTTGHYDLAIQEFQQYVQAYGDTDLASNAQFYIGDSYYNQKKYDQAVQEYNKCLERYPSGNKLAAAQLKKAYALIALGSKQAGQRELRSLIRRFPHSHEAELARQRLKQLSEG